MILILLTDLVVVLSLAVLSRRSLEAALPLFCFILVLFPVESRLVIPGLFDLTTTRVAILTIFVLYIIKGKRTSREPVPLKYLMYLQVAWALASTLYSISFATSAKQLIGQVLEYYLLYYLLVRIISRLETVYNILYAVTGAMALCSVFGLFEAYASWSVLTVFPSNLWLTYGRYDPLYIEWGRGLRLRSTFPHPILFGDALAMTVPIALYLTSVAKDRWRRLLLGFGIPLMLWALYKTSSRGPWIAAIMSSILLFCLVRNRVRKYLVVLAMVAAMAVVTRPGVWQTISNLYESTQDANSPVGSSYEFRHALVHAISNAVTDNPARMLFGYGLGTFREKGLEIEFLGEVNRWHTCDNNWLLFLYETGFIGLLTVGVLLVKPLLMALRNYWRLPPPQKYCNGVLLISLAEFCFALLSVAGYSWGQQASLNWMLVALSVVYPRLVLQYRRQVIRTAASLERTTPSLNSTSPVYSTQSS
jgi:hypothetical protein